MKNLQKGSVALWLIIIIVIVLAAAGYFYYSSNNRPVANIPTTNTPVSNTQTNTPAPTQTQSTTQGLNCNTYASAADISSIFGVTGVTVTTRSEAQNNECELLWTYANMPPGSSGGHFYVSEPNYNTDINTTQNTCTGNVPSSISSMMTGLHSEGLGSTSCYFTVGVSPVLDFIENNQVVMIGGDISSTEAQMMQLARLVEGRL